MIATLIAQLRLSEECVYYAWRTEYPLDVVLGLLAVLGKALVFGKTLISFDDQDR